MWCGMIFGTVAFRLKMIKEYKFEIKREPQEKDGN